MNMLIINGPNLNMLGIREPNIYGSATYEELCSFISGICNDMGIDFKIFQSNSEGGIIDEIQNAYKKYDAIIINPAAYTHTSIAIADALKAVGIPAAEVHLSNTNSREPYRKVSYVREACEKTYSGYGFDSYKMAILYLHEKYRNNK